MKFKVFLKIFFSNSRYNCIDFRKITDSNASYPTDKTIIFFQQEDKNLKFSSGKNYYWSQ